jgi:hypothetical protein
MRHTIRNLRRVPANLRRENAIWNNSCKKSNKEGSAIVRSQAYYLRQKETFYAKQNHLVQRGVDHRPLF